MSTLLSIIIPVYNAAATIEQCLQAVTSVLDDKTELIVVDDGSIDQSVEIIRRFPCKLIQLNQNRGAAHARNIGAWYSQGEILFFTDADCLLDRTALFLVKQHMCLADDKLVIGGSYTSQPYDDHFYSRFQSVFIHYSETKHTQSPDYIATHAMAIKADIFHASGGFAENIGPILEDVEFSHRLRRAGKQLKILPELQVQHIFNYSLSGSWRNAIRKTRYWVQYSFRNHDLFADSGTASLELKSNVCGFYLVLLCLLMYGAGINNALAATGLLIITNLFVNYGLLRAFYNNSVTRLTGLASMLYYLFVYPIPVGIGILAGLVGFMNQTYVKRWG